MARTTYKIRSAFLIPLSVDTVLLFVLLAISFFTDSHPTERIILSVIFIPLMYVLLEVVFREVSIESNGITIKKLLRRKTLEWEQITNIDTVVLRKKVYLAVTTTKGFFVVSNSYGNFPELVRDLIEHLSPEKVEGRVREIISTPIRKISDIVGAWLAALLLVAIIYTKLFVS